MSIPADQIDPDARKVVRRLVQHHYEGYLVGGCVRDLLLQRKPKDFDIATSATPNEVKALFRNCRIIGRRFRLAHIFFGPKIIETATFRANPREGEEGELPDASTDEDLLIRRDNVFGTAEEDARRRDFTINGLFYDLEADQVIDYVGGLGDLARRSVATIGDPQIRFREDPVRILRAIKFSARLDFGIEQATWQAILDYRGEIPKCAPPRVLEEIYRLMRGGAARRSLELLRDTGVLDVLLPEIAELLRDRPDAQETRWLWQILDRIDSRPEDPPGNGVLLSALAVPFIGEALLDDAALAGSTHRGARDLGGLLDERLRPIHERMRVSRRDAERTRQILLALRRVAPSKRRRGRATTLLRRDYFAEAVQVYALIAPILRPDAMTEDELRQWQASETVAGASAPGAPGEGPLEGEAGDVEGRRRRRRRRGGRREREPGVDDRPVARDAAGGHGEGDAGGGSADDDAPNPDEFAAAPVERAPAAVDVVPGVARDGADPDDPDDLDA